MTEIEVWALEQFSADKSKRKSLREAAKNNLMQRAFDSIEYAENKVAKSFSKDLEQIKKTVDQLRS